MKHKHSTEKGPIYLRHSFYDIYSRFPSKHKKSVYNIKTLGRRCTNVIQMVGVCWAQIKCSRRYADVVQMLFKCFVFAGFKLNVEDVRPTLYKCYSNVLCLLGLN